MGCGSSATNSGTLGEAYKDYLATKEKVRASPSFSALYIFYNDLFPLAKDIIKKNSKFDELIEQLDKFSDVIQDFKNVGPLAPLADILSILPLSVKPALQASKAVLINMQDESKKFVQKYDDFFAEFKPYFDLIKQVENKKAKLLESGKRYEHGKLVIEYGRYVADECFKMSDYIDQKGFVVLVKFIEAFDLIDKLSKDASKVGDLTNKDVPLTGKKVKDFFESGGSNPVVAGVRKAIEKMSTTIEENVKKVEEYIKKIQIYKFPQLAFVKGKLVVNDAKVAGGKISLIKALPEDWVKKMS